MNQRKKKTAATNCISLAMIDLAEVTEQTWEGICVYRLMPADKPKKDPCIMNHECASWHTQQHRFIRGLKAIQGGDMGCQGRVWWVQGLYIFFFWFLPMLQTACSCLSHRQLMLCLCSIYQCRSDSRLSARTLCFTSILDCSWRSFWLPKFCACAVQYDCSSSDPLRFRERHHLWDSSPVRSWLGVSSECMTGMMLKCTQNMARWWNFKFKKWCSNCNSFQKCQSQFEGGTLERKNVIHLQPAMAPKDPAVSSYVDGLLVRVTGLQEEWALEAVEVGWVSQHW